MKVEEALSQISEIRAHLARTEVCRVYRPLPVLLSGFVALGGALVQTRVPGTEAGDGYILFWLALAVASAGLCGAEILANYLNENQHERKKTRCTVGQFVPCLVAGGVVTAGAAGSGTFVPMLPGLWAIFFALGILASRPYLPRATGWVAVYYLCAGGALLALAPGGASLDPWAMGLTFGPGQLFAGSVLLINRERRP